MDDQWTAMPENESIEKDYCDPKNTIRYCLLTFNGIVVLSIWDDIKLNHLKVYTSTSSSKSSVKPVHQFGGLQTLLKHHPHHRWTYK